MSMFSLDIYFDHIQFALIHGPNITGSYAILLFRSLDLASITSHIHSWVLFLLWLHPFIHCGVISPLISSSILGTYWPGEFFFQYSIILPFHTVHGVLKAKILKWFAIPFSSEPHSVRSLLCDPFVLGGPLMAWLSFTELGKAVVRVIRLANFLWLWFQCVWSLMPSCTPTILLGFFLPWAWGIFSRLLQQSTAAVPYLGRRVSPHSHPSWPLKCYSSSRPSC